MKIIKTIVFAAALLLGIAVLTPASDVFAQTSEIQKGVDDIGGSDAPALTDTIKTLINVFLFIIGALAVVMVIYGGFKYVTSAGESSAVSSAKNTILYAVVGLVIAVTAYAIVNFVLGAFSGGGGATDNQGLQENQQINESE